MPIHEANPSTTPISFGEDSTLADSIKIDELFARFQAIYGHKWLSQFPSQANFLTLAKAEWESGLEDLSKEAILRGVAVCKQKALFPPSIAEFRHCCLPSSDFLGLPSVEEAMQLILRKKKLPLPIEEALDEVGKDFFRFGNVLAVTKAFRHAYEKAIERHQWRLVQKSNAKRIDRDCST